MFYLFSAMVKLGGDRLGDRLGWASQTSISTQVAWDLEKREIPSGEGSGQF